jgi:hypothetical protein
LSVCRDRALPSLNYKKTERFAALSVQPQIQENRIQTLSSKLCERGRGYLKSPIILGNHF